MHLLQPSFLLPLLPVLTDAHLHPQLLSHTSGHKALHNLALGRSNTTQNELMLQGFEWYVKKDGQHWNWLNGQLDKLARIGVDRLWIPPATKAGANPSTGYDVYDLWDLGEFNQKGSVNTSYGTKQQLTQLSQNAAAAGISLLLDGVMNQRSGADEPVSCQAHTVDENNRLANPSSSQQIQAWVGFKYGGRRSRYSNKTWGCNDFTAVDYDNTSGKNAIWKIEGQNNDFATDVSQENGNYDFLFLADVAFENPSVQEDVKEWGRWVTQELSLGGFRLDAAKHISRSFLSAWVANTKSVNANLLVVAEYLTADVGTVQSFVDGFQDAISVYDTPLQTKFHEFSTGTQSDLRTVLNDTWLSSKPRQAVTYVNNHDTQAGQALGDLNVSGWFVPLAYALSLLREDGLPCIFYGDIYGVSNNNGTFQEGSYAGQIADLALARKYFAYGAQSDYFNDAHNIGWTRRGDSEHPDGLAVVMSNAQGGIQSITMNVGSQHAGESWSSLFVGGNGTVTIGEDGSAGFVAGAGTINMYTRADAGQRNEFGQWEAST